MWNGIYRVFSSSTPFLLIFNKIIENNLLHLLLYNCMDIRKQNKHKQQKNPNQADRICIKHIQHVFFLTFPNHCTLILYFTEHLLLLLLLLFFKNRFTLTFSDSIKEGLFILRWYFYCNI